MDNFNLDGSFSDYTVPVSPTPSTEGSASTSQTGYSQTDQVEQSKKVLSLVSMIAGLPQLDAPFNGEESHLLELKLRLHVSTLVCEMWENYSKEVAEENDRRKAELFSPKYLAWLELRHPESLQNGTRSASEFNQYINSLPVEQREREIAGNIQSFLMNVVSDYVDEVRGVDANAAAFMVTSLMISAGFIGQIMTPGIGDGLVGTNPIIDGASPLGQVLPQDLAHYMSLTINLFVSPIIYQTVAEVATLNKGAGAHDLQAAKDIARQVLDKVNSNEINHFLMALLVSKQEGGEPISNERMTELAQIVKLVMLATALALLYKTEAGAMTSQEFSDLVAGNLPPNSDEEKELVEAFKAILATLPKEDGGTLLNALTAYMGGRPSVDHLLHPLRVYQEVAAEVTLPPDRG